jgi:hypothetical protein
MGCSATGRDRMLSRDATFQLLDIGGNYFSFGGRRSSSVGGSLNL